MFRPMIGPSNPSAVASERSTWSDVVFTPEYGDPLPVALVVEIVLRYPELEADGPIIPGNPTFEIRSGDLAAVRSAVIGARGEVRFTRNGAEKFASTVIIVDNPIDPDVARTGLGTIEMFCLCAPVVSAPQSPTPCPPSATR